MTDNNPQEEPEYQWLEDGFNAIFGALCALVSAIFTIITNLVCAIFCLGTDEEDDSA